MNQNIVRATLDTLINIARLKCILFHDNVDMCFNIQEIKRNVTAISCVTFVIPCLPGSVTVWKHDNMCLK